MINTRIAIYAKDVMMITGRGKTYSYSLIKNIKKEYKKEKGSFITLREFCLYTGLKEKQVEEMLD